MALVQAEASAPSSKRFTYGEAPLGTDEIRILMLLPPQYDKGKGDIHCRLFRLDLKATESLACPKHPFLALSYVWGDSTSKRTIFIDNREMMITSTLYDALEHIRTKMAPVPLWVDAICINQDDQDEAAREVLKMKTIYSECQAVIYWLGVPDESTEFQAIWGFSPVLALAEYGQIHDELREQGHQDDDDAFKIWAGLMRDPSDSFERVLNHVLAHLLSLPFWKRVWIAQEFILARDGFFMFGTETFSIHLLEAIIKLPELPEPVEPFWYGTTNLIKKWMIFLGAIRMRLNQPTFLDALVNMRYRLATKPHDYIYGILGVASMTNITPDYSKPKKQVFMEAMEMILDKETNLDILSTCDRGWAKCASPNEQIHNEEWPTWLPDWSFNSLKEDQDVILFRSILLDFQESKPVLFSAAGSTKRNTRILNNGYHLQIRGMEFDTVAATIGGSGDGWYENIEDLWLQGRLNPIFTAPEAFRRLCNRTRFYGRRALPRHRFDPKSDNSGTKAIDQCPDSIGQYDEDSDVEDEDEMSAGLTVSAFLSLNSSTYFVTSRGFLGRGPVSTAIGDKACVFFGGKVPFLLREQDGSNTFQLVGEAYIHRIMKGAAIDVLKGSERDFILA